MVETGSQVTASGFALRSLRGLPPASDSPPPIRVARDGLQANL